MYVSFVIFFRKIYDRKWRSGRNTQTHICMWSILLWIRRWEREKERERNPNIFKTLTNSLWAETNYYLWIASSVVYQRRSRHKIYGKHVCINIWIAMLRSRTCWYGKNVENDNIIKTICMACSMLELLLDRFGFECAVLLSSMQTCMFCIENIVRILYLCVICYHLITNWEREKETLITSVTYSQL